MEEDTEFLKLSVEDRCQHKLWKARLSGYEEAAKLFRMQDDEKSPEFSKYQGMLKKFIVDSNAIAQEKGLAAVLAFVENAASATKTTGDIMNGLVSKCFLSPRARTRELALEITLMYVEIEKQDVVIEELIKGLNNKSPKIVFTCIVAIRESLHLFGSQVISIKSFVKVLPKLLEDRDKTVREETKLLIVEIYKWCGDAIKPQLQSINAVTLKDLEGEFQKVAGERVLPTRYLKSQQVKVEKIKASEAADVEVQNEIAAPISVDPFDLMTPVDILAMLPKNFYEECEAQKWQERKEALENLLKITTNVKMEAGDYGDLARILKRLITKDSNVLVVSLAVKCLTNIIIGLRKKFQPYASSFVLGIFEKFKEKKQNVVLALRNACDALLGILTFENMSEDIEKAMNNKNPQVRSETCAFLSRGFATCPAGALNKKLLKGFTSALLKTLNDTDLAVRENSAMALGTALKVVGERAMKPFLNDVDAIKMAKIKEFCDQAVVATAQTAPATLKSAPTIVKKDQPEKQEPPPVQAAAPIKKPAATIQKPKVQVSSARIVKPAASKKAASGGGGDSIEPDFKEAELDEETVHCQAIEILTEEVVNKLSNANWKDRLAAIETFQGTVQNLEKNAIPAQVLVKLLTKKPGFKENNMVILKLRFEILTYIIENSRISQISVETCLSDIVDKIGDAKTNPHVSLALTAFAVSTSLQYIGLEVLKLAFNQKNPKNQSETLIWLTAATKQFGLKLQMKETIEFIKKAFSSTNPAVRNAALGLAGTIYMYVGKSFRSFFEGEKPALLQQIDAEFEKMKDLKPPIPEKCNTKGSGDAPENSGQFNLADLMPRVDISDKISSQLLSDLSDKDWHLRSDALQKILVIISDAKFVLPSLGDLPNALKPRLNDTNKKIAMQALNICEVLGEALGSNCPKQIRNFAPSILVCLGDSKPNMRAAAVQCLNTWMDQCSLSNLFEFDTVSDVLKTDNPFLRIELFTWLTEKMPAVTSLPAAELNQCVPILLACVEDRNPDVRRKAVECILPFMIHVGYESMARAASKLKAASKATVVAHLDKARQSLPAKASAKPKPAKSAGTERAAISQNATNDEESTGKLNRSISKSKLALKTPNSIAPKAKKDEEIDTSPTFLINNLKDQRLSDEKALKVLKWNFTSPREEFYQQLKDQMITANWNKTITGHCFHSDFKFHIKAIDLMIESLQTGVEASAANLDLILKWLSLRFFDTNPSVLLKSLEYLQLLFQALDGMNYHLLEPEASSFIPYLILKIGDPKDSVRKGVKEIIKIITKTYPYSKMFSYIMQGLPSKNARQRAECLDELGSMIETYGLNACQPSPAVALKEIAKQISDRDNSVRTAALNCVVLAYFIEGEKVYKYVGQLSDKDQSLLDERIKRCMKTKSKHIESGVTPMKVSPPANINAFTPADETRNIQTPRFMRATPAAGAAAAATPIQSHGPLKLDTDDIEQMFRQKASESPLSGLIPVNADEILNLPDIQLPQRKLRTPASSLKLLNNSSEVDTAVNIVMAQLAAQDIPVVVQAFAQIDEVLKQNDQAERVLGPRVDQLLVMGAMQYRYAHTKHMADENICKADVVSLYRCVTVALVSIFDNPELAKKASRDVLRDLIPHLITVMLDNRLDDLQEGAQVVKVINVLIMRVLQKSNCTHSLSALIKLLHDCVGSVNVSDRFTDLVMKCLWKMIRMIRLVIKDLNIDRILLDIHVFLKTYPSSTWKDRPDTPIRTIKTILYKLVEVKGEDIMKHLSLISDRQESDLVNYLHKLLARKKDDGHKSLNKNISDDNGDVKNHNKRGRASSPLKLSKSTHEALTDIFKKIGCKEQTKEGLAELYEFKQNHPEADIEPYLKNSSDFFQNYIRQGIQQFEKEKTPVKPSPKKEETWNMNLAAMFPPVPPSTVDTTPMDYLEWIKTVVARLGMDTSKYDDPAVVQKIIGNENDGPMTVKELADVAADVEKYKKIIEELTAT